MYEQLRNRCSGKLFYGFRVFFFLFVRGMLRSNGRGEEKEDDGKRKTGKKERGFDDFQGRIKAKWLGTGGSL